MKETIVIGMPLKNNERTAQTAIESVLSQKDVKRHLLLFISLDKPDAKTEDVVASFLPDDRIFVQRVQFGSAYQNRNFINCYVRNNMPKAILLGRLDGDDYLHDDQTIKQVEQIWEKTNCDALLMGNKQSKNGEILGRVNRADRRLLDYAYLEWRLQKMAQGIPEAELPSCNTFIRPSIDIDYPAVTSAEDHWFTILLLLQKSRLRIHIAEDLTYCVYSLDGQLTGENKKRATYLESRKDLLEFFRERRKLDEQQAKEGTNSAGKF